MALITIDEAKQHLRIDADDADEDLDLKMEQATEIVLDYLKTSGESGWDELTVPRPIHAAILLVLTALWEDREGTGAGDYLKPGGAVANLLVRFRDPAMA